MEFYKDELHFLRNLVGKYFIWLTSEENMAHTQNAANKLHQAEESRGRIASDIQNHLRHLEEMIDGAYKGDEREFRNEHALLEDRIAAFLKTFRTLKNEVFALTEHVIESEKLQHLLTP